MSKDVDQLYESLFTFEQMLTESIAQCAEVFELAERAGLPHVITRLKQGVLPQLQQFLDESTPHSMSAIIESIETGDNSDLQTIQESHTQPTTPSAPQPEPQYVNTGNPKYDEMFNSLLESSVDIEQTGRVKFKLDEVDNPPEHEIEQPQYSLYENQRGNNPPRQPGRSMEKVEFDGMENWRTLVNESSPMSSSGGDAGDVVQNIMSFSESTPASPPPGSPEIGNDTADVDPSVANILSNL